MFEIYREIIISSSHRLTEYEGKCSRLHGHNWRIGLWVRAKDLDEKGMVTDFHKLKDSLAGISNQLDHQDLNQVPPFNVVGPTAENMAKFIFEQTSQEINTEHIKVFRVEVWETPGSCAAYQIEPC